MNNRHIPGTNCQTAAASALSDLHGVAVVVCVSHMLWQLLNDKFHTFKNEITLTSVLVFLPSPQIHLHYWSRLPAARHPISLDLTLRSGASTLSIGRRVWQSPAIGSKLPLLNKVVLRRNAFTEAPWIHGVYGSSQVIYGYSLWKLLRLKHLSCLTLKILNTLFFITASILQTTFH